MDRQRLLDIQNRNADSAQANQRHQDLVASTDNVSSTVVKSVSALAKYLDGKVTKTEVINQLKSIGTPDVFAVVQAVNNLHTTLKSHKNTDLSGVVGVMNELLNEVRQIPKENEKEIDYTSQLASLKDALTGLESVVKAQELVVNVPEAKTPVVNVKEPNLKPLQDSMTAVVEAVKAIVIPEFKSDNSDLAKLQTKTNKLLKDLLDKPTTKGGARYIQSPPYLGEDGSPSFVTLINKGAVPSTKPNFAQKITVSGANTYVAQALIGTAQSSAKWQVKKVNTTGGDTVITWADGDDKYDNVATDLTALSYS